MARQNALQTRLPVALDPIDSFDRIESSSADKSLLPPSLATLSQPDPARRSAIADLIGLALALGAESVGGPLTESEDRVAYLARTVTPPTAAAISQCRDAIKAGDDPLGDRLCGLWPAAERRSYGAFYTAPPVVQPMLDWVLVHQPDRLVDPGCGSGRFAAGAVRRRPNLRVVAIDVDPVATMIARANLAVFNARDARVLCTDYTTLTLPPITGRTAFIGNPPYVRHHDLSAQAKRWAVAAGRRLGHHVSALAGLHAHFYLATALHAQPGDIGCFVTSAEWLDVNYGRIIRELLLDGLGGHSLHLVDPKAVPFADAMATAAIACFEIGTQATQIKLRVVQTPTELGDLNSGEAVSTDRLQATNRWSVLVMGELNYDLSADTKPLGDVARVHRGIVTGANQYFVMAPDQAKALGLDRWCQPVISSAREILESGGVIRQEQCRKVLLNVPANIDRSRYPLLDAYLRRGEQSLNGDVPIAARYVTSRRRPWWNLGLSSPAPIVASYMARQAPAFALNPDGVAIINIAHGIYPNHPLSNPALARLVDALNGLRLSFRGSGRTYHGGLEKFEPREMEALPLPSSLRLNS